MRGFLSDSKAHATPREFLAVAERQANASLRERRNTDTEKGSVTCGRCSERPTDKEMRQKTMKTGIAWKRWVGELSSGGNAGTASLCCRSSATLTTTLAG